MTDVRTQSAEAAKLNEDCALIAALLGGTKTMRAAGKKYLPQWPGEDSESYDLRLAVATLAPPIAIIEACAAQLTPVLREQFGAHGLDEALVTQWLLGFLAHLRRRGAVFHAELGNFASDGNLFGFLRGRNEWMPSIGSWTPKPVFLTLGQHKEFDKLTGRQQTWFDLWAAATLGRQMLLGAGQAEAMYLEAIKQLITVPKAAAWTPVTSICRSFTIRLSNTAAPPAAARTASTRCRGPFCATPAAKCMMTAPRSRR